MSYLDECIDASGAKIGFLCTLLGVDDSTLYLYRSKKLPTPYEFCVKFSGVMQNRFDVPCDLERLSKEMNSDLARPAHRPRSTLAAVGAPPSTFEDLGPLVEVPVYSYAAAGPMTDEALVEEDEPMLVVQSDAKRILVRIRGRSLEPHIKDGELVKIERDRAAQNGELVIFKLDEYTGCGFLVLKGRRPVEIEKSAPGYKNIPIKAGQTFSVQGVVIKIVDERDAPRSRS